MKGGGKRAETAVEGDPSWWTGVVDEFERSIGC